MSNQKQTVQILDTALIEETLQRAHQAPRLRTNYNFHPDMADNPHRFLNVMLRGTYITPHRHSRPPKAEAFLMLRGLAAFFIFQDDGNIAQCQILDANMQKGALGIDIAPGVWHCLVVLSDECVCYEVKPGPYDPSDDKEFASWAPAEGTGESSAYLKNLEEHALQLLEAMD